MDFDDLDELEEAHAAESLEAEAAASSQAHRDPSVQRCEIRPLPEKESVPVQLPAKETKISLDTAEEKLANAVRQGALKNVQAALKELAMLAQSGESRTRVVHVLAAQLREASGKDSKPICVEICWNICSMAFSLSGQDIDFYPGQESGPVVLVAGYAGSHIDDVRPVAERWATHYGAAVVTLSPCTDWMGPQQAALYKKVISLLAEGRQLVIHTFSNGGFQPASNFLTRWFQDLKAKKEGIPPITALRCMILDSIAIGDWDVVKFKTYADMGWGPAPTWEEQVDKLFKSLGLALFLYHGVIESTISDLGMTWGRAVFECVQSGMVKLGMRRFAWTCAANLEPFWARQVVERGPDPDPDASCYFV